MDNPLKDFTSNFSRELQQAHANQKTSLEFIRHTLSIPAHNSFDHIQAITIGGTFYNTAVVSPGTYELSHQQHGSFQILSSAQTFLSLMERLIRPEETSIAVNFAYPLKPVTENGTLDGVLLNGSKEHTFNGLVGKQVGKTIQDYMWEKRKQKLRVSVANDTICLLLSGLTKYPWNQIAAGIVGTGMNFAIFEDEYTAVNLESGSFDKFEQSEEGKIIDAQSAEPGTALFEKEVSGAYLYKQFNLKAEKEGISTRIADTSELDTLAKTQHIARDVLDHSAHLIASQIAGILEYHKRSITFVMQGSLFWKGYNYKNTVDTAVKKLTNYSANYIEIDHADLLGAAKLVM